MRRSRITVLAGILFFIVATEWTPATNARPGQAAALDRDAVVAEVIKGLRDGLPAWIKERDVPGVAVAVVDDKDILWQGVYGYTSRAKDRPVTPRTLFSIQSMSKSFTALAVLMAVQDGLVDLDRPVTDYLPDFTVHSRFEDRPERKMTLRHLLAHRAGFTHEAPVGGNYDSRPHAFAEHILSISDTWLRYPVGHRYSYSNLGIDLAGWVLEKKSGVPFPKYVREKVLAPLGMADSTLDIEAILKAEDRALGHIAPSLKVAGGIPVEVPMVPAGGVYTNILDMARYLMFHINKGRVGPAQVLRRDLVEAMHTVQFPEKGERFGYGLGIASSHIGPETYLSHGGGGYGFITYMVMYPGLKLGVVSLTNMAQNAVDGGRIVTLINGAIETRIGPPGPDAEKPTVPGGQRVPPGAEVERLKGTYAGDVVIGTKDGVLGITVARQLYPLEFVPDGGSLVGLFGKYSELRALPRLGDQGSGGIVVLNRLSGTCAYYDFHKPEAAADTPGPDKPEWKPYLGIYKALSWGRTFGFQVTVGVADGYLTVNGGRCREHLPGLFFTFDGEALDLRGTVATFRNIPLIRTRR